MLGRLGGNINEVFLSFLNLGIMRRIIKQELFGLDGIE